MHQEHNDIPSWVANDFNINVASDLKIFWRNIRGQSNEIFFPEVFFYEWATVHLSRLLMFLLIYTFRVMLAFKMVNAIS